MREAATGPSSTEKPRPPAAWESPNSSKTNSPRAHRSWCSPAAATTPGWPTGRVPKPPCRTPSTPSCWGARSSGCCAPRLASSRSRSATAFAGHYYPLHLRQRRKYRHAPEGHAGTRTTPWAAPTLKQREYPHPDTADLPPRRYVEGHCDGTQPACITAARPPPGRRAGGPHDGWSELNVYIPILVLGAIAAAFAVGSVVLASLVGPTRHNPSKLAAYECGVQPTAQPGR